MRIKRKLNQYVVYWAPNGFGRDGSTAYADPVELNCRWEDSYQNMVDAKGEQWTSKAAIDTDVPLLNLGILWRGRLRDLTSRTDPMANPGASAIRSQEAIPSVSGKQTLYTSYL